MAGMEFSISSLISWMVDIIPCRMSTGLVRPTVACSVRGVLKMVSAVVSENEVWPSTLPGTDENRRETREVPREGWRLCS
jgi:hypothetical protein